MANDYSWWRKALQIGGGRELSREQMLPLGATTEPQPGFYRRRAYKDGPFVPIAIWRANDQFVCLSDGKQIGADQIEQVWTWCCRWPITEALYHEVVKGGAWPDEPPAPKDHNQVKTGDDAVDLMAEFEAEAELAKDFLKKPVQSQEQADQIAVWSKKIAGILSSANVKFKAEKQPWTDGGKKVDDRWRWRQDADTLAKSLKRSLDAWLNELDRREKERQRRAAEEAARIQREADEARRKAEEAERAAQVEAEDGSVSMFANEAQREADRLDAERKAQELAERAAQANREAEARNVNAGRTGARVSLRTFYEARIVDYDKLVMALKDEPEVREAIAKIANRIARTQGAAMPEGSERIEERRAA